MQTMLSQSTPPSSIDQDAVRLVASVNSGEQGSFDELFTALHAELRSHAERHMSGLRQHTLQPTALVSEAYVRLQRARRGWSDPHHFLMAASRAMRHILVDHYRGKTRLKKDAKVLPLDVETVVENYEYRATSLVALDVALEELEHRDPTMAKAVDLHFFGGIRMGDIPDILNIHHRKLDRDWRATRAWLNLRVKQVMAG